MSCEHDRAMTLASVNMAMDQQTSASRAARKFTNTNHEVHM